MKKALSLILLTISITMALADCSTFLFSDMNPVTCCTECPDVCGHFESSHSHGQEDHFTICDSCKTIHFFIKRNFQVPGNSDFTSNHHSSIWQPPKLS